MSKLSAVVRTLFPVTARDEAAARLSRRSTSGQSTLLGQLLAICFAATPLLILVEAVAVTA